MIYRRLGRPREVGGHPGVQWVLWIPAPPPQDRHRWQP